MSKLTTAAWEQDEFWKEVVNVLTGGKKLRPDSYLQRLSAEDLQALFVCLSSGASFAEQAKSAPKWHGGARDGQPPSETTLGEISQAIRQVWMLRGLERQQMLNAATKERGQQLGLDSKLVDVVLTLLGEEALAQRARGTVGDFAVKSAFALLKREDQSLDQQKAEAAKKSDHEKALELCLTESKAFPEVQELFKSAFAALKKAKGNQNK